MRHFDFIMWHKSPDSRDVGIAIGFHRKGKRFGKFHDLYPATCRGRTEFQSSPASLYYIVWFFPLGRSGGKEKDPVGLVTRGVRCGSSLTGTIWLQRVGQGLSGGLLEGGGPDILRAGVKEAGSGDAGPG